MYDDEEPVPLGTVLTDERGSLPFLLVHGEALAAAAAWSLGESGVMIVDESVPWSGLVEAAETFVLHDSLCPLTPPDFIAACVERCRETGAVVVATRPVTDTVKRLADGYVGATVDRDRLRTVCSPVVLPGSVVAALPALPTLDLTELVVLLRASYDVVEVEAPPSAARVSGRDDVRVLEGLGER
ncbi:2-C-methyl-D-erythritol 4-phosphate cytidylyltransferase [Nocardioides rubriscoriae]|uniref:2-C-methyl-D-erythritol 4-phosphate cytidylyltransferase n=1 Tax=Nocardioides rubriscoriae TaxID=642762 RepID=UPI0011E039AC|nr:2-C-methyl-D-erythritol 4-phosphate cytidylyltransferase [Nocardioides rubriscoriae]